VPAHRSFAVRKHFSAKDVAEDKNRGETEKRFVASIRQ